MFILRSLVLVFHICSIYSSFHLFLPFFELFEHFLMFCFISSVDFLFMSLLFFLFGSCSVVIMITLCIFCLSQSNLKIFYCFRNNIRTWVYLSLLPSCLLCMLSYSLILCRLWNPTVHCYFFLKQSTIFYTRTRAHAHTNILALRVTGIFTFLVVFIFFCRTGFCYHFPSAEITSFLHFL